MNESGGVNKHRRPGIRSQGGFITLMALIILAFILSVANAYLTAGTKEIDVARVLLAADQARQAAHAGTRLVAGLLVEDANSNPTTDHHGENWYLATENTAGVVIPREIETGKGVYFTVLVVDLSGRMKANASDGASTLELMKRIPHSGVTNADWATAMTDASTNDYWTISEYATITYLGNDRVTGFSPYGTDFRININTADVKDDAAAGDPPDIINAMLKMSANYASTNANTLSRKLLRVRRGGLGQDNNVAWDPPAKENNPLYVSTGLFTNGWYTMAGSFTTPNTNPANESRIAVNAQDYGRINSEGFFIVKSLGWVVEDPLAGSGGARRAQYQVMRYIYRTVNGYQDCANREWYYETRDLPVPPYASTDYDHKNTFFIIDSNF